MFEYDPMELEKQATSSVEFNPMAQEAINQGVSPVWAAKEQYRQQADEAIAQGIDPKWVQDKLDQDTFAIDRQYRKLPKNALDAAGQNITALAVGGANGLVNLGHNVEMTFRNIFGSDDKAELEQRDSAFRAQQRQFNNETTLGKFVNESPRAYALGQVAGESLPGMGVSGLAGKAISKIAMSPLMSNIAQGAGQLAASTPLAKPSEYSDSALGGITTLAKDVGMNALLGGAIGGGLGLTGKAIGTIGSKLSSDGAKGTADEFLSRFPSILGNRKQIAQQAEQIQSQADNLKNQVLSDPNISDIRAVKNAAWNSVESQIGGKTIADAGLSAKMLHDSLSDLAMGIEKGSASPSAVKTIVNKIQGFADDLKNADGSFREGVTYNQIRQTMTDDLDNAFKENGQITAAGQKGLAEAKSVYDGFVTSMAEKFGMKDQYLAAKQLTKEYHAYDDMAEIFTKLHNETKGTLDPEKYITNVKKYMNKPYSTLNRLDPVVRTRVEDTLSGFKNLIQVQKSAANYSKTGKYKSFFSPAAVVPTALGAFGGPASAGAVYAGLPLFVKMMYSPTGIKFLQGMSKIAPYSATATDRYIKLLNAQTQIEQPSE